ncbi:MAG: hypothetical protein J6Q68_03600, partial [Clostridia bacterium]|nr:hypothetical protein [Clostridia bacterium]
MQNRIYAVRQISSARLCFTLRAQFNSPVARTKKKKAPLRCFFLFPAGDVAQNLLPRLPNPTTLLLAYIEGETLPFCFSKYRSFNLS